jgi:fatty acid desaturase
LTFIAPIVAYYDYIRHFDDEQIDEDRQNQIVWQARLIAFVVTVGLWIVIFLPIAIWKYMVISIWFLYHFGMLKRVLERVVCE